LVEQSNEEVEYEQVMLLVLDKVVGWGRVVQVVVLDKVVGWGRVVVVVLDKLVKKLGILQMGLLQLVAFPQKESDFQQKEGEPRCPKECHT
jgi:hypothetical protein